MYRRGIGVRIDRPEGKGKWPKSTSLVFLGQISHDEAQSSQQLTCGIWDAIKMY
jgi:hypothetical protein